MSRSIGVGYAKEANVSSSRGHKKNMEQVGVQLRETTDTTIYSEIKRSQLSSRIFQVNVPVFCVVRLGKRLATTAADWWIDATHPRNVYEP